MRITENKNFTKYLVYLIIVGSIVVSAMLMLSRKNSQQISTTEKIWAVKAQEVRLRNNSPTLMLYGFTRNPLITKISASITAFVEEINVTEGQQIEFDQNLILLDPKDIKIQVAQKQALVNEIKAEIETQKLQNEIDQKNLEHEKIQLKLEQNAVKRQQDLLKTNYTSKAFHEQAISKLKSAEIALLTRELAVKNHPNRINKLEAGLDNAQASLDKAKLDYSRTIINAPFAGKISKIYVGQRDLVQPGTMLLEMFAAKDTLIDAQIPDNYISIIKQSLNNKSEIEAQAIIHNQKYPVKLKNISALSKQGHGGIDGLFYFSNPDKAKIGLEQSASIELKLPAIPNSVKIPQSAIYNNNQIFIIENSRLLAAQVKIMGYTKENNEEYVIVTSPELQNDDQVLITPLSSAITGLKVNIVN